MDHPILNITPSPSDQAAATLIVSGEIDLNSVGALSVAVQTALAEQPGRLTLDLGGVTFCDSTGLGTFVVLSRKAASAQTVLVLANIDGYLRRTIDITGLDSILTIH